MYTFVVSEFEQNARVVVDNATNKAMIIDPGADIETIYNSCKHCFIEFIFLTHCHIDHAGGVKELLEKLKTTSNPLPKLAYHSNETPLANYIENIATMYSLSSKKYQNAPAFDIDLKNETTLTLGNSEFEIIFTPGHAPGHVCLYYNKPSFNLYNTFSDKLNCNHLLIGGDTLFLGGHGRTDLPYCNHEDLITSIKSKLLCLPDDTLICTGHGENTTVAVSYTHLRAHET